MPNDERTFEAIKYKKRGWFSVWLGAFLLLIVLAVALLLPYSRPQLSAIFVGLLIVLVFFGYGFYYIRLGKDMLYNNHM